MKKIIIIAVIFIMLIISLLLIFKNKEYNDENVLYTVKFSNTSLRIVRYDYSLGNNQIIGVEKYNGKTYKKITKDIITVSMEPKFIFLNKQLGFIISKSNLTKSNNYLGLKVTNDGGINFIDSKIIYDNINIDILTIEDVPYIENKLLKLPCSIYQINEDKSGYEDKKLIFISYDNGLTWYLEE